MIILVNKRELKAEIYRKGFTITELSSKMGISKTALYNKINDKIKFSIDDVKKIIEFLNLNEEQVYKIFFAKKVT